MLGTCAQRRRQKVADKAAEAVAAALAASETARVAHTAREC